MCTSEQWCGKVIFMNDELKIGTRVKLTGTSLKGQISEIKDSLTDHGCTLYTISLKEGEIKDLHRSEIQLDVWVILSPTSQLRKKIV